MKPNLSTSMLLTALRWLGRCLYWLHERREESGNTSLTESLHQVQCWMRSAWKAWRLRTNYERQRIEWEERDSLMGELATAAAPFPAFAAAHITPEIDHPAHVAAELVLRAFGAVWPLLITAVISGIVGLIFLIIAELSTRAAGKNRHLPNPRRHLKGVRRRS